jgi:hypothetical protein
MFKIKFKTCGHSYHIHCTTLLSKNGHNCNICKPTKSYKEILVGKILSTNGIEYKNTKTFDNLLGVKNRRLSYDYYFKMDNIEYLIEINGEQHYKPIPYFGGFEKFEIQKEHDKRKIEYATANNMILITIPYSMSNNKIREFLLSKIGGH